MSAISARARTLLLKVGLMCENFVPRMTYWPCSCLTHVCIFLNVVLPGSTIHQALCIPLLPVVMTHVWTAPSAPHPESERPLLSPVDFHFIQSVLNSSKGTACFWSAKAQPVVFPLCQGARGGWGGLGVKQLTWGDAPSAVQNPAVFSGC